MARGSQVRSNPEGLAPRGKPGIGPLAPWRGGRSGRAQSTASGSQPAGGGQGASAPEGQSPHSPRVLPSSGQGAEEIASLPFSFFLWQCFRGAWTFPNWFCWFQTGSRLASTRAYAIVCVRTLWFQESTLQSENESSVILVSLPAACPSSLLKER